MRQRNTDVNDKTKDAGKQNSNSEQLAIILFCSIVGVLFISIILMAFYLWYRRWQLRHSTAAPQLTTDAPEQGNRPPESDATGCSWCYIAEDKVCKWCSGEAEDEDEGSARIRRSLLVGMADLQQSGWRSVLTSPTYDRAPSPRVGGGLFVEMADLKQSGWRSVLDATSTHCRSPSPRGKRTPVDSVVEQKRECADGGRNPVDRVTGKTSLRLGGTYEVAMTCLPQEPGRVRRKNDSLEVERTWW